MASSAYTMPPVSMHSSGSGEAQRVPIGPEMKPVGLVTAHIYDVGTNSTVRRFNFITESLFQAGAYHAGIEVYGRGTAYLFSLFLLSVVASLLFFCIELPSNLHAAGLLQNGPFKRLKLAPDSSLVVPSATRVTHIRSR